jgi:hypothetical protein
VVVALVAGILLMTGCGSSGSTSGSSSSASSSASSAASATTAGNTKVCQDVAALRASAAKMTHVTVSKGAVSTLAADAKDVRAKLTTLANDAGNQWSSQISALKSALSKLQSAVTGLGNGGSLSSVASALAGTKTAAQNLLTAAGAQCPSSPSTG